MAQVAVTDAQATQIINRGGEVSSITGLGTATVTIRRWDGRTIVLTAVAAALISATSDVTGPETTAPIT